MILGKAAPQGASVSSSVKWRDWTWSMGCKKRLGQEVWCYRTDLCPSHCNESSSIFVYFSCPVSWVQCVWQQDRSCAFRAISEKQEHKITLLISNPGNQSAEKVRGARAERESLMEEAGPGQTLREGSIWKDRRKRETEHWGKAQWYVQAPRRQDTLGLERTGGQRRF